MTQNWVKFVTILQKNKIIQLLCHRLFYSTLKKLYVGCGNLRQVHIKMQICDNFEIKVKII